MTTNLSLRIGMRRSIRLWYRYLLRVLDYLRAPIRYVGAATRIYSHYRFHSIG
eukprot:COSAG01_NODE_3803_length_5680_cov_19.836230_2_plen_53_part_00